MNSEKVKRVVSGQICSFIRQEEEKNNSDETKQSEEEEEEDLRNSD